MMRERAASSLSALFMVSLTCDAGTLASCVCGFARALCVYVRHLLQFLHSVVELLAGLLAVVVLLGKLLAESCDLCGLLGRLLFEGCNVGVEVLLASLEALLDALQGRQMLLGLSPCAPQEYKCQH